MIIVYEDYGAFFSSFPSTGTLLPTCPDRCILPTGIFIVYENDKLAGYWHDKVAQKGNAFVRERMHFYKYTSIHQYEENGLIFDIHL